MRLTSGEEGMEQVGMREGPRALWNVELRCPHPQQLPVQAPGLSYSQAGVLETVTNPSTMAPPAVGREQHT